MIYNIGDIYTAKSFVGYVDVKLPELEKKTELKSLFPDKSVVGLDFSYIKTTNGIIELTIPSAYDAEPIAQHRKGFDAMKGELPLFRRKTVLSEKERQNLAMALASNIEESYKAILRNIYDDQMTLITGAEMTKEFLRTRVLMDGKITIESNGGAVNFDYKVPSTHKDTLTSYDTWEKPDAKIATQIRDWCDIIEEDTGVRPDTMILNRKTFKLLRENKEIRANMVPLSLIATATIMDNSYLPDTAIMDALKAATGLSNIIVYGGKVSMDGKIYDLIEDKKVALFPSSIQLGNTLNGISPAEFSAQYIANAGNDIAITADGIAVNAYVENKAPYTAGTEVEFVSIPSFEGSDYVFQATVQE